MKIAIYADLNYNLIDGSAIWMTSLVKVISGISGLVIHLYLKRPIESSINIEEIFSLRNVFLHLPKLEIGKRELDSIQAINQISLDDHEENYDAFILRGKNLCFEAARHQELNGRIWAYFTDIPIDKNIAPEDVKVFSAIIDASKYLLIQTPMLAEHVLNNFQNAAKKIRSLPPMVPSPIHRKIDGDSQLGFRVIYSGQFKREYASLEMLRIFRKVSAVIPAIEFHIYGEKIHANPDDLIFKKSLLSSLEKSSNLIWHKGVTRQEVLSSLSYAHIGWAWRLDSLEQKTLEISTKLLEYCSYGVPPIMARNKINEDVFGSDYPLFANSEEEALQKLIYAGSNKLFLADLKNTVKKIGRSYQFSSIRESCIKPLLKGDLTLPQRVLTVVGHDLKFIESLTPNFEKKFQIAKNLWWNHKNHDVYESTRVAEYSDVIFCEWFLGNAVWHSQNKHKKTRLIVRFHRQELETEYPLMANMDEIDAVIVVSEHTRRDAVLKFNWEKFQHKINVIDNGINVNYFGRTKYLSSEFNIGMVGIVPKMKRIDLALDLLELCKKKDSRFKLFIKGGLPDDYQWLKNRPDEMAYYNHQFSRIKNTPSLKDSVVMEGWGVNMGDWYRNIGHILSVSDFEGTHQAVAEGGASGAIPYLLPWDGGDEVYGEKWVYPSLNEISEAILRYSISRKDYLIASDEIKNQITTRFSNLIVSKKLLDLLDKL